MGSFNVAGSVSNLSISAGTKCVFIPLLTNRYEDDIKNVIVGGESHIISNEGPECFFAPFSLPIFGTYNDYGSLEDIERNDNTDRIENFFGCQIDAVMEQATRNWCNENSHFCLDSEKNEILSSLSGMFEHADIYQTLVNFNRERNPITYESIYDGLKEEISAYAKRTKGLKKEIRDISCVLHPLNKYSSNKFLRYFQNWRYFRELYGESITEGKLKKELADAIHFRFAMNSCNRFFFPAMNGEQCGNPEASKMLLLKSLEIVNKELEKEEG